MKVMWANIYEYDSSGQNEILYKYNVNIYKFR